MPKVLYINKNFRSDTLILIEQANSIIGEYARQGFDLTLRQLYYQFVARDIIENSQKSYKRLGDLVNNARLAGLIDWETIVDRTRNLRRRPHWNSPQDIVQACAGQYHVDMWEGQSYRPEVWIEKDSLVGVIAGVCEELDVPYFSCRGYPSQSEVWGAAQRLIGYHRQGQIPYIVHLGDHDPSGIDMTRDIIERLSLFIKHAGYRRPSVSRIALNMSQVQHYQPPPNPAKFTDSRCSGYVKKYGTKSWELDALSPDVLASLIRNEVVSLRSERLWAKAEQLEQEGRKQLSQVADNWDSVVGWLQSDPFKLVDPTDD